MKKVTKKECILLFAYGILKKHGDLVLADHVIDATMFDLGCFPAITKLNSGDKATGNIIKVTANDIKNFDIIEGVPDLYKREVVGTPVGNAFIYVYQNEIESNSKSIENWGIRK